MSRPRIWGEPTEVISLRLPMSWVKAFLSMSDEKNPSYALMLDALKQYLRKAGKLSV